MGMVPVSWFSRYSHCKMARLPSWVGIVPVNWLPQRNSHSQVGEIASSAGIVPVNWFLREGQYSSLARLPSSVGIVPVNWFPHRDSVRRLVRLPSPDGIWPVNAFSGSINPVTRSGVPPSATPSHWSTGMFADQFSVALPAKLSLAASSTLQSDAIPGLLVHAPSAGGGGSCANPCPQLLLGSGLSRCVALSFR